MGARKKPFDLIVGDSCSRPIREIFLTGRGSEKESEREREHIYIPVGQSARCGLAMCAYRATQKLVIKYKNIFSNFELTVINFQKVKNVTY
jgi:hypothetical protein